MSVPPTIQRVFMRLADAISARRSFPVPDGRRLKSARIVSHRGSHDNRRISENTLAAFDRAVQAGVWGVEMDMDVLSRDDYVHWERRKSSRPDGSTAYI